MENVSQQPQMGLTFEQVWSALMETRANIDRMGAEAREQAAESQKRLDKQAAESRARWDESQKRLDKQAAESRARWDESRKRFDKQAAEERVQAAEARARWAEAQDRLDKRIDQTSADVAGMCKRVDRMSKTLGGLGDSLGRLIETLIAARLWKKFDSYKYNLKRAYQRIPLYDENNRALTDIDILLSNGEYVMAVEVKREFDGKGDIDHHLKRMELIKKYPSAECKDKILLGAIAGGTVSPDAAIYAQEVGFFVLELKGESVHLVKTLDGFIPREW